MGVSSSGFVVLLSEDSSEEAAERLTMTVTIAEAVPLETVMEVAPDVYKRQAFVLYDRALHNMLMMYRLVWRPKLHKTLGWR